MKTQFITLLPRNNIEKSFIYKDDILYLENLLEETLSLYHNDYFSYRLLITYETNSDSISLVTCPIVKEFNSDFDRFIKSLVESIQYAVTFDEEIAKIKNDNATIKLYITDEQKADNTLKPFVD